MTSCTSKKESCLGASHNIDKERVSVLIDTGCVYIQKYLVDLGGSDSSFLEQENIFIRKARPGIRFFGNGRFAYYNEYLKNPSYGTYKFYNDTIEVCREYYSVQSGKHFSTSIFIFQDSIIVEKGYPIDKRAIKIYSRECNNIR